MPGLKSAAVAIALLQVVMTAAAGPALASRIAPETAVIHLAENTTGPDQPAEADRIELVARSAEMGAMTTANAVAVSAPAPAALAVFGIGLLGLAAVRRLRRR
jgi:hypothetical protein